MINRDSILNLLDKLSLEDIRPHTKRLFRIAVYLWFLIYFLWIFPIRDMVWGMESFVMPTVRPQGLVNNFFYILSYVKSFAPVVLWTHLISIVLCILGLFRSIPKITLFLTGWMLYYAGFPIYNSGYLLYMNFAFLMIFIPTKRSSWMSITIGNFAYLACIVQFLLVYLIANYFKMRGETWLEGSSIHYSIYLDHFVPAFLYQLLEGKTALLVFLNFASIAYQFAFPILVWVKKIKYPLLLVGVAFHLGIAIMLSLPLFGLGMVFGYLLFLEDHHSKMVLERLRILAKKPN